MSHKQKWYHKQDWRWKSCDTPEVSYKRLTALTFLIFGIICILGSLTLHAQWSFNKGVPVKQEYTNYLNGAAYLYDPLLIVQTLEHALQGIENLGLKPTDSGAAFSWDVNYHHTVQFNIDQIISAIDYGNNVIEWKEQSYHGTVVENVNDVYNEKVVHLRNVAGNPNIGNIEVAYCFNHKPELFWYPYMPCIFLVSVPTALVGLILVLAWDDD